VSTYVGPLAILASRPDSPKSTDDIIYASHLVNTFVPIILKAGTPLTKVSLANIVLHFGQEQGTKVKSLVIRCLKHLIRDPLPPLRYLNN